MNSLSFSQLDSRSFFFGIAPGAESGVSGFVTLLAAAHALRNVTQEDHPNRTILYTLFHGVSNVNTVMATCCCSPSCFLCFHMFFFFFFNYRKPLTTLAVQEWSMICRTMSLLWIWIMFIQSWRLDRYNIQTLYKVHSLLLNTQNQIKLI